MPHHNEQYDCMAEQWLPYDPDANCTMPCGTERDTISSDIFDWLFERAPKAISRKPVQRETLMGCSKARSAHDLSEVEGGF
jgi:hypothetical protein